MGGGGVAVTKTRPSKNKDQMFLIKLALLTMMQIWMEAPGSNAGVGGIINDHTLPD